MTKTSFPNPKNIKKEWVFIDANDTVLGKLATEIALNLTAKNKAYYTPNQVLGSTVVVTNAEKVHVTGKKMENKIYYHHTGFPGGLKAGKMKFVFAKNPSEIIRRAVKGMLPKNKLQKKMMSRLYIYNSHTHPHQAQEKGIK